jgi:hypothetical protein
MVPNEKRSLRRLAKLGIANFESVEEVRQRQTDLLRRLERAGRDPGSYVGFHDCRLNHCGLVKCADACSFGTHRRWLDRVLDAHKLLTKHRGPLYEVRLIRDSWQRPIGKLNSISIGAAKQFHRRRLDTHYSSDVLSVGLFKTSIDRVAKRWIGEIHVIIAGMVQEELRQAFAVQRRRRGHSRNICSVKAVSDLASTLIEVFKPDLRNWHPPNSVQADHVPKKRDRAESYGWRLHLAPRERLIRYGADRYFNQLQKKPRVIHHKVKKKRPYPHWLERHMFGSHDMKCECRICIAQQTGQPAPR